MSPELTAINELRAELAELRAQLREVLARAPERELLTAAEVAELLKVNVKTVYARKSHLGAQHIGERGPGRKTRLRFDSERVHEVMRAGLPARVEDPPRRRRRGPNPPPSGMTAAGNPLLF